MNNPMQIMQQFQKFREDFQKQNPNVNPQEYVQRLMSQGKVSQTQFEQARKFAETLGFKM